MLGWLKRRYHRGNNYLNCITRHISSVTHTDMFVSEPTQCILTNVKLIVVNSEGKDYCLDVPLDMTIESVRDMAVGHFFSPQEVVRDDGFSSNGAKTYRLVLVREARQLAETNSVQLEQLLDNDELLLQERRPAPLPITQDTQSWSHNAAETQKQIQKATANLPERTRIRPSHLNHQPVDFQIEFRRILITMIVASIRLISAEPDSESVIKQILDKLERRHRPQVDRNALKQLIDMGFSEVKATKALHVTGNRGVQAATEWLLEQSNEEFLSDSMVGGGGGEDLTSSNNIVEMNECNNDENTEIENDPTDRILKQFLEYRKKWFQPNPQALQQLQQMGFNEATATGALRACGNKLQVASNLLATGEPIQDCEGLARDSPIIAAIFASPVIQLALPKPKTLLALMMLYESPNNANMWLSDPDTHPIVSQVIRIYHAEKHSLGRPNAPVNCGPQVSTGPISGPQAVNSGLQASGGPLTSTGPISGPQDVNSGPQASTGPFSGPQLVNCGPQISTGPISGPQAVNSGPQASTGPFSGPQLVNSGPQIPTGLISGPQAVNSGLQASTGSISGPQASTGHSNALMRPADPIRQVDPNSISLGDDSSTPRSFGDLVRPNLDHSGTPIPPRDLSSTPGPSVPSLNSGDRVSGPGTSSPAPAFNPMQGNGASLTYRDPYGPQIRAQNSALGSHSVDQRGSQYGFDLGGNVANSGVRSEFGGSVANSGGRSEFGASVLGNTATRSEFGGSVPNTGIRTGVHTEFGGSVPNSGLRTGSDAYTNSLMRNTGELVSLLASTPSIEASLLGRCTGNGTVGLNTGTFSTAGVNSGTGANNSGTAGVNSGTGTFSTAGINSGTVGGNAGTGAINSGSFSTATVNSSLNSGTAGLNSGTFSTATGNSGINSGTSGINSGTFSTAALNSGINSGTFSTAAVNSGTGRITGQTHTPNSAHTQIQSFAHTPGFAHTPITGQAHTQGSAHTPSFVHTQIPSSAHTPITGQAHTHGSAHTPSFVHTQIPSSAHTPITGQAHTQIPSSAHTPITGQAHTQIPSSAHTPITGQAHTQIPSSAHTPGFAHTQTRAAHVLDEPMSHSGSPIRTQMRAHTQTHTHKHDSEDIEMEEGNEGAGNDMELQ